MYRARQLGMCKYGYLDDEGEGIYCEGAHASHAECRAAKASLEVHFADGAEPFALSTSSDGWQKVFRLASARK